MKVLINVVNRYSKRTTYTIVLSFSIINSLKHLSSISVLISLKLFTVHSTLCLINFVLVKLFVIG